VEQKSKYFGIRPIDIIDQKTQNPAMCLAKCPIMISPSQETSRLWNNTSWNTHCRCRGSAACDCALCALVQRYLTDIRHIAASLDDAESAICVAARCERQHQCDKDYKSHAGHPFAVRKRLAPRFTPIQYVTASPLTMPCDLS
jgi:hypothetical protein